MVRAADRRSDSSLGWKSARSTSLVSIVTTIGSVGFVYDATNHTENATPYTLCGDNGAGAVTNCNLAAGAHTLTATPYSAADLGGTAGTPLTITFTLAQ